MNFALHLNFLVTSGQILFLGIPMSIRMNECSVANSSPSDMTEILHRSLLVPTGGMEGRKARNRPGDVKFCNEISVQIWFGSPVISFSVQHCIININYTYQSIHTHIFVYL